MGLRALLDLTLPYGDPLQCETKRGKALMAASGFGTLIKLSGGQFSVENGRQPRGTIIRADAAEGRESNAEDR